jgi:hypothetical protein
MVKVSMDLAWLKCGKQEICRQTFGGENIFESGYFKDLE